MLAAALVLLAAISIMSSSALAAVGMRRPLPASDYSVRPACGAPLPGHASCLADKLVPETAAARAHSHPLGITLGQGAEAGDSAAAAAFGLRPEDLHEAYNLPLDAPEAQTIGIVNAYDDPTAEQDLRIYDEEFGLPACTTANHCFRKINQRGSSSPLPEKNLQWESEISLDVQTAHAVCQNCQILLVEASSSSSYDLGQAVDTAAAEGATEISNSYGGPEGGWGSFYDHPGVVVTASTGDWGYDNWAETFWGEAANSPASLPTVVAVGGTSLAMSGESWASETAWREGGSGCSEYEESAPPWQSAVPNWTEVGCGSRRAAADVAADADPYTGMAIYDSGNYGWGTWGGTSLASPIVAATFALAGGAHGVEYPAQTLYSHLGTSGLHDVVSGSNWGCSRSGGCTVEEEEANCSEALICNAGPGYDGPTGVGTPDGLTAFGGNPPGPPPTVTDVSPLRGSVSGGNTVTIEGTGLENPEHVQFGAERAAIISDSEDSITVEAPAYEPGLVNVTVTDSEGLRSATSEADHYEYFVAQPRVASVMPVEGPSAGGTGVTIDGADLGEAEYVEFGTSYAPVESATDTSITTTSPEHEPGSVNVTVVGPYGVASATTPDDLYTYLPPPAPPVAVLTIGMSGSGHGVVFVSPADTICESTCSETFTEGTQVFLSATATAGSMFLGWSGAGCSGTSVCAVTLSGDIEVTASFEILPPFPGSTGSQEPVISGSGGAASRQGGAGSTTSSRVTEGNKGAYSKCRRATRRAFLRAKGAAKKMRGKSRLSKLARARRLKERRMVRCRSRFLKR